MYDAQVACMCCNTMVLVRSQDWKPTSAGLCMLCYQSIPFRILRVIYTMRHQIGALYQQFAVLQQQLSSGA